MSPCWLRAWRTTCHRRSAAPADPRSRGRRAFPQVGWGGLAVTTVELAARCCGPGPRKPLQAPESHRAAGSWRALRDAPQGFFGCRAANKRHNHPPGCDRFYPRNSRCCRYRPLSCLPNRSRSISRGGSLGVPRPTAISNQAAARPDAGKPSRTTANRRGGQGQEEEEVEGPEEAQGRARHEARRPPSRRGVRRP